MQYLEAAEYERYGLDATTSESFVRAASALIESHCRRPSLGLAEYTERLRVAPGGRVRLSYLPLCATEEAARPILRIRVRCTSADGCIGDLTREFAQTFGLAGTWSEINPSQVEFLSGSGEVTIPTHALGLAFTEAEITYTAGFETIPEAVKFACAQLVKNAEAMPALNVRRSSIDRMEMEYFGGSLLDDTVKRLLAPFVSTRMSR